MNLPATKKGLGVNPELDFQSCNMQVNQAFALQGDGARNRAKLLPELIHSGIRLLIYAGDADMACNYIVRSIYSALRLCNAENPLDRVTSAGSRSSRPSSKRSLARLRSSLGSPSTRASSPVGSVVPVISLSLIIHPH